MLNNTFEKLYGIEFDIFEEETNIWDEILRDCFVYTDYLQTYMLLCKRSMAPRYDEIKLLRFIFYNDKKPCAVWHIQVRKTKNIFEIGSNDREVLPPLFTKNINKKVLKNINKNILNILKEICLQLNINAFYARNFVRKDGFELWYGLLMENAMFCSQIYNIEHMLYVDLQKNEDFNITGSCKNRIKKGLKTWNIKVFDKISYDELLKFREFHVKIKGKSTREMDTWEAQADAANKGEGVFIELLSEDGKICAGAIFIYSADELYYNSSAYDKNYQNHSETIQYIAIKYARERGVRWYRVGERFYKAEQYPRTQKEITISQFKEKFASNMYIDVILKCELSVPERQNI